MQFVVVDYDPAWPHLFETLRKRIAGAAGPLAIAIEHVGSTSVPGLAAKPIIDITVVVETRGDVGLLIDRLAEIGYRYRGDLGIEDREAFEAPEGDPAHHLYACPDGTLGLRNHLAVRDHLRANPNDAARYGSLKKELAGRYGDDIDAYIDAKTDFLVGILAQTDLTTGEVARIESANRIG